MKINKINTYELEKCYSICPLTYNGQEHILIASEIVGKCLLFSLDGVMEETIWREPGGTMGMSQIPGSNGEFLAIQKFYSLDNSKEAKIVLVSPRATDDWVVRTLIELPFVHRIDIIPGNGVNYLIACALKSGHEYEDDWRFYGKILVCELPRDLSGFDESHQLGMTVLKDGLLKNHGYCRVEENGQVWAAVAADNGIFKIIPPIAKGEEWGVETLTKDAGSDVSFADLDGDGELEMLVITPFHGDIIKIYKKINGSYICIKTFEKTYEFSHAIWGTKIFKKGMIILGNRMGDRDLMACTYDGSDYVMEVLDYGVGSANVRVYNNQDKIGIVSTNREIDQIAFYEVDSV